MDTARCFIHAMADGLGGQYASTGKNADVSAPYAKPTMAFRLIDGVMIAVHDRMTPSDRDWDAYMMATERRFAEIHSILVFTAGGNLNGEQRRRLVLSLSSKQAVPSTALVTSSGTVHAVVNAVSWFLKDRIKAFRTTELAEALTYLEVVGSARARAYRTLAELCLSLELKAPAYDEGPVPARAS